MTYPKGERVRTSYYNSTNEILFIVTSKNTHDFYFLYEYIDGIFKKLGKGKSPLELEERFNVYERMRA